MPTGALNATTTAATSSEYQSGPYAGESADDDSTGSKQIVAFYDRLLEHHLTPVVALNRPVAVSRADNPAAGLTHIHGRPLARPSRPLDNALGNDALIYRPTTRVRPNACTRQR
jgi:hypothetical protein